MSTTVYLGGKRLRLEDRDLLGTGGEGSVYRAGDRAIKVFFEANDQRARKLAAFPSGLPARVVGPLALCADAKGNTVGYAMRALDGAVDLHRLGQRKWREASMTANDVLAIFRELVATITALHARGVVVGDLNDGNVVLTPPASLALPGQPRGAHLGSPGLAPQGHKGAWQPWFIDADSMQFAGFPCTVAHERFLDPRLYGVDLAHARHALSPESDAYALAVLLFSSLLFVHPYGGAHASYPTLLRRAEARHSVLRGDVKLPHAARCPEVLPDDALAWFADVFDRDRRALLPPFLLEPRFVTCSCGAEHARRACPVCTVAVAVPAAVRTFGNLRVTRLERAPEVDFDHLFRLEGDWLVRAADSTRIGQVLEGQTHVAAGASLGFAFYRAGRVTMQFLFDAARGPLRQLALPHLEGRLVDWQATFDDGHVLFCTATEKAGHVIHAAHLIDKRGEVLASETGPAGSSAILSGAAGLSGKCLKNGAVLVPTDDGLVLVRADRATRTFVPARAFPETRDLVPPDADLLVGPGGSIYVVTHDEILHLCFEGNPGT